MALRNIFLNPFRFLFFTSLIPTLLAQTGNQTTSHKSVEDWLPLLANNEDYTPARWRTRIGGQNFTWCCTKAVNDSVVVDEEGNLTLVPDGPAINLNLSALIMASDQGQFPCTASYDEDHAGGSPEINVEYTWLADNCPGWQLSTSENLNGEYDSFIYWSYLHTYLGMYRAWVYDMADMQPRNQPGYSLCLASSFPPLSSASRFPDAGKSMFRAASSSQTSPASRAMCQPSSAPSVRSSS